jgi:hypothetical protein
MYKLIFLILSGTLWVIMMQRLYEREIIRALEYETPPSYRALLMNKTRPEYTRMGLYQGTRRLGQLESFTLPQPDNTYLLINRGGLEFPSPLIKRLLKFKEARIYFDSTIEIDQRFQLKRFKMCARGFGIEIKSWGQREGTKLIVQYKTPFSEGKHRVDFPKDMTLVDNFLPFSRIPKLEVGKKWIIKMADISLADKMLRMKNLYAQVEAKEKYYWQGRQIDVFRVGIRTDVTDPLPRYLLWVTPKGEVLEEMITYNKGSYRLQLEEHSELDNDRLKRLLPEHS